MKRGIFSILFIAISIFIFNKIDRVITYKINDEHNNSSGYYGEKEIDILFLGTSRIYDSISPMYIWDKYGVVSYNRARSVQYYKMSYYLAAESIKRNKPKIIIVDVSFFVNARQDERAIHHVKNMRFSPLKIDTYLDIYNYNLDNYLHIYTNLDEYHNRWKTLIKSDFLPNSFYKGFSNYVGTYNTVPQKVPLEHNPYLSNTLLQEDAMKYVQKIVDLGKTANIHILFTKMPSNTTKEEDNLDEQFEILAKTNNWNFINYNKLLRTIHFDYSSDMMDWSHVNYKGARKVMDHLLPYVIEHYNIPNRKDDPAYASWNEDYKKYEREVNSIETSITKSFSDWQKQAFYDNYTVLLSANGDVLRKLPDTLKNDLKSFGLKKYNTNR